ncbi:MAG: C40 family peptidase [Elusimicrobiota bacterium]
MKLLFVTGLALSLAAAAAVPARATTIAAARKAILKQTLPYLNVPYLWGGNFPKTGLDCSGFVQLVYHVAGLNLPRVSREQFDATRYLKPKDVLPGDLIFFAMAHPGTRQVDHVGIYLGKGLFIAASVTNGIHVEPVSNPYYLQRLVSIRRYAGF